MAKQLNVNLAFKADTKQAHSELQKLQTDLYNIANSGIEKNLTKGMKDAGAAAKELSYHLNQAYNTSTGNIDLSKLNASLKKSSTSVTELSNRLLQAGSMGQEAFTSLAKSISKADYPMFKLNSQLTEMWTTLKNTARWQLSSSMLHGFMGTVQKATSYCKDLDESLNHIRIVTGMSSEQMDAFAVSANRAAKALSTTTTAYANAALIFYQQGLNPKEVEERTAITIKMAQTAGESAADVSSYMTAIWNNFNSEIASGQRSLESFGDTMAKLGAETAASSAEIAAGLEQFAAIGDTVGLSFDYASAAVTTIVDKTRQSANTVGTALKTIFARLQGLQLGETLEDGVDLNKYSEALKVVGVEVLDFNGQLKDADEIINSLGERWGELTAAQKTALAQTVAGTRQYAQLMSLMDNFDSFLENVTRAKNADGALDEQAEIFADSWEAARKRVDTAAQGIYDSLIDRDFIKDFNNVLADVLTGIEKVIDGIGGFKGVISAVGTFALSFISHKIQPAIQGLILNIQNLFTSTQVQAKRLVSEVQTKNNEQINSGNYDKGQKQILRNTNIMSEARTRLAVASKQLTEQESALFQQDLQFMQLQADKAEAIAENITLLQNQAAQMIDDIGCTEVNIEANRVYNAMLKERNELTEEAYQRAKSGESKEDDFYTYQASLKAAQLLTEAKENLDIVTAELAESLMKEMQAASQAGKSLEKLDISQREIGRELGKCLQQLEIPKNTTDSLDGYKASLEMIYKSMPGIVQRSKTVHNAVKNALNAATPADFNNALKKLQKSMGDIRIKGKDLTLVLKEFNPKNYKEFLAVLNNLNKEEKKLLDAQTKLNQALAGFNPKHVVTGTERLVSLGSAMGQVAMMAQSVSNIIATWHDDDLSFGEKLSTTFISLSTIIPGVIASLNNFKTIMEGTAFATWAEITALKKMGFEQEAIAAKTALVTWAKKGAAATDKELANVKTLLSAALKMEGIALDDNQLSMVANRVAKELLKGATLEQAIVTALSTAATEKDTAITNKNTAAKIAAKLATQGLNAAIKALSGPIGIVILAITALIVALTAYFKISNKIAEEEKKRERENRQDRIEEIKKEAEAYKTARQEYERLLETYNTAIQNSDGTADAQKAIADATWDLCKALGVEIDLLDQLQGNVEGYNVKIAQKEADDAKAMLEDAKNNSFDYDEAFKDSYDGTASVVATIGTDGGGHYNAGEIGTDTQGFPVYAPDYGDSASETEDEAVKASMQAFFESKDFQNSYGHLVHSMNSTGAGDTIFYGGTSFEEQYEVLSALVEYLKENNKGDLEGSEIYTWYRDLVKAGKDAYSDAQTNQTNIDEQIKNYAMGQTQAANKKMFGEVTTPEEYQAMREDLIANIEEGYDLAGEVIDYAAAGFENQDEFLNHLADQYLSTYNHLMELQSLPEVADKTGIDEKTIEELYNQYKDVFFKVNFDTITSEEQLRNLLENLQAQADAEAIEIKTETKLAATQNAQGMLKKDMSPEDYEKMFKESGVAWGKEGVIEFTEFLKLSYDEQYKYLQDLEVSQRELLLETHELKKELLEEELQSNITNANDLQKQIQDIQDEFNAVETKLLNGTSDNWQRDMAIYYLLKKKLEKLAAAATAAQGKTEELQGQIDDLGGEIELEVVFNEKEAENQFNEFIAKIQEISDPITAVFDAISGGVKRAMDESGNAVWSFSSQAVQAIEKIYPGFMQQLTIMKDGTFKVSDEMYQKVFDTEHGKVLIKAQSIKDVLELERNKYYAEAKAYQELADKAYKIARGEVESEAEAANLKREILEAMLGYEEKAGEASVLMSGNVLEEKIDSENQYRIAVYDTAEYVKKVAGSMGDGVASGTAGGARAGIHNFAQLSGMAMETARTVDAAFSGDVYAVNADDPMGQYATYAGNLKDKKLNASGKPFINNQGKKSDSGSTPMYDLALIEALESNVADQIDLDLGGDGANTAEEINAIYTAIGNSFQDLANQSREIGNIYNAEIAEITSSMYNLFKDLEGVGGKALKELIELVENFHYLREEIKSCQREIDKLSKAADRAYGANKISIMKEMVAQYEQLAVKQDNLRQKQEDLVSELAGALQSEFSDITFDEFGNISNYSTILGLITQQYNDALSQWNDTDFSKLSEEQIKQYEASTDNAKKQYDRQKELLDSYEDALGVLRDEEDALLEIQYAIQDLNFARLQEELNIKISISEDNLRVIELKLKRLGDSFFKRFEALVLSIDKFDEHEAQIGAYVDYKNALDRDYLNGDISQSDYIKGYQEAKEGIAGQIEAMIELDQQMLHYYGDTLQLADEELRKYTEHMEHLTSVLDHYLSLVDLLGKKKDYGMMRNFLEGKASTVKDQLDVEKANYNMLAGQRDAAKASLDAEIARLGGQDVVNDLVKRDREGALSEDEKYALAAYELLKNNWDDAVKATDAAQEAMLEKTEEWVSAMKAVIENNMAEINETLEKSLTGGTSFDELMDGFDKLNERQEEYLTKTNQMYETTKMIRTANKAMDETDNKVAKQKIKNFIEETKNLQNTTKLSKYELEIQQAKYDLLLAEIALEEAKNAKSTVRLSRDSEGNFGYVYTADQDKVSEAEQAVDDAKNNIYNISLEGQQEYTEKYLQAQQSMYDELTELHNMFINGDIATEEEYQRRKDAILNHYLGDDGVLTTYSKLYGIAVSADAAAMQDNWQREYGEMTKNTETWKVEVNKYLVEMEGQINTWKDVYVTANEAVDGALDNSAGATKDVVTESHNLATTVTKEVIPAIDSELTAVRKRTEAYAAQRAEILANIDAYIKMLEQMNMVTKTEGMGFDPDMDYSAAINEYLNAGGVVGDEVYNKLVAQREEKIAWLKTGAAGEDKADQSYWQFEGKDYTKEIYDTLVNGGEIKIEAIDKLLDQDWFKENYMSLEELKEDLRNMGIPEEALENLKDVDTENAEATQANADENAADTQANADKNAGETQANADENAADTQANADENAADTQANADENAADTQANADENAADTQANADENTETLDATLNDVNQSVKDVKSSVDAVNTSVGTVNTSVGTVNTSVGTVNSSIGTWGSAIVGSVKGAATTISTAVGGLANRVTTLETNVTNMKAEMVAFEGSLSALAEANNNNNNNNNQSGSSGTGSTGSGGGGGGGKAMMEQMQFASGGYTGDWGPEGKLAVLHEKEIVLNASDTENILSAVGMIRDISNMIDFNAGIAGLASLSAVYGTSVNSGSMEQTVTIHAEFPNAVNHNEIEEAFNSLVNKASQYAFRR